MTTQAPHSAAALSTHRPGKRAAATPPAFARILGEGEQEEIKKKKKILFPQKFRATFSSIQPPQGRRGRGFTQLLVKRQLLAWHCSPRAVDLESIEIRCACLSKFCAPVFM